MAASATRRLPGRNAFTPRGWLVVAGGVATSALLLGAWMPLGALLAQRSQLSAAQSRIAMLAAQGRILSAEAHRLTTPVEAERLARQEYQLVAPGQRLIQVLTPSGTTSSKVTAGGPFPGDPGLSAPVVPSASALAPSVAGSTSHAAPRVATSRPGASSFLSRVLSSLEFWR